jgi:hypothetical protein
MASSLLTFCYRINFILSHLFLLFLVLVPNVFGCLVLGVLVAEGVEEVALAALAAYLNVQRYRFKACKRLHFMRPEVLWKRTT